MSDRSAKIGVFYGLAAYLSWGLFPIYFKALHGASSREILAHRIIWSALLLVILTHFHGQWPAAKAALRDRRVLITLLGSTVLIAVNWLTFIETMIGAKVLQASMGYFINPLVNVLFGYIFLGERLRPLQKVSVVLAAVGVLCFTWIAHQIPVYPLVLALSFALYGLLRKTVRVEAMVGLTVETLLLTPLALGYLA
jgi:chloramphenicol-sensitive protein RarD